MVTMKGLVVVSCGFVVVTLRQKLPCYDFKCYGPNSAIRALELNQENFDFIIVRTDPGEGWSASIFADVAKTQKGFTGPVIILTSGEPPSYSSPYVDGWVGLLDENFGSTVRRFIGRHFRPST